MKNERVAFGPSFLQNQLDMKKSLYSEIRTIEGKKYLYNTKNDSILILDDLLVSFFNELKIPENFVELQQIHPTFYAALEKYEYIVPKSLDEYENLKGQLVKNNNVDSMYKIIINPTMNCNFKCWYCYESHIKNSRMNEESISHVLQFIRNTVAKYPKLDVFVIDWFGGEPLLEYYTVVVPILNEARKICHESNIHVSSSFTTNGFLINDKMIRSFKELDIFSFQITLDGNEEQHNRIRFVSKKRGSYKEIIDNIILLANNDFEVVIRINYDENTLLGIDDILDDLREIHHRSNVSLSLQKVWQVQADLTSLERESAEKIRAIGFEAATLYNERYIDSSCYADTKNEVVFNYNGDVFKCTARDFTAENRVGVLLETGEIDYNYKANERESIRFFNESCKSCKIFPFCGGGCSEVAYDNYKLDQNYCVHNYNEDVKNSMIDFRITRLIR